MYSEKQKVLVFAADYDTGDGCCIRDYVNVTDLADAHPRALDYFNDENQDLVLNLGTYRFECTGNSKDRA